MPHPIPKILLIENEPTLAEITAFRLELMGYRVEQVASGDKALEAIGHEPPDLIIIDLLLAGEDGFVLADRLASDEQTHGIPLMALSSRADLDDVQRAFSAGVKEYLVTPYDPSVLEQKLEKLVPAAT